MSERLPPRPAPGARPYRLTGTGAFEAVFRDGARFDGRQVQIIAKPAALPVGRFGLVVGRKALRRAVDRNRFRRLVREAFRGAREQTLPYDVIVRLKAPLPRGAVDAAAREAADLLARAVAQMAARSTP